MEIGGGVEQVKYRSGRLDGNVAKSREDVGLTAHCCSLIGTPINCVSSWVGATAPHKHKKLFFLQTTAKIQKLGSLGNSSRIFNVW